MENTHSISHLSSYSRDNDELDIGWPEMLARVRSILTHVQHISDVLSTNVQINNEPDIELEPESYIEEPEMEPDDEFIIEI